MDQQIKQLVEDHPEITRARYVFLDAVEQAGLDEVLALDWWEHSIYAGTRPRYDEWLDSLPEDIEDKSRYQLQQRAPAYLEENRTNGRLRQRIRVPYQLDPKALAAYWRDQQSDLPTFVAADAIPWLEENPRLNLLTKKAFIKRLMDMGASLGDAREAWRDSRVRRVRQHFRTTQTRIIRAQMPQLQLAIVAPPGFYQADVFEMETEGKLGEEDSHMALVMIEIYSRKAFVKPVLDKSAETIKTAVEAVIQEITADDQEILAISGDNDFKTLQQFCDANKIYLHTYNAGQTHNAGNRGGDPLGIINRFANTFKHFLRVYMIAQKESNWVEVLPEVLKYYNEEHYHSELGGLTPDHVFDYPESIADIVRDKLDRNDAIKNLRVQKAGKRITDQEILAIIGEKRKYKRAVAASLEEGDNVLVLAPKEFKGPRKNLPEVATVKKVDVRLDRYQLEEYNDMWFQRGELYKVNGNAQDLDVSDFERARKTLLQNKERRRGERRAEQYAREVPEVPEEPDVRLHDEHARLSPYRQEPEDQQSDSVQQRMLYPTLIPKLDNIVVPIVEMEEGEGFLKIKMADERVLYGTPGIPDPTSLDAMPLGEMLLRRVDDSHFHMSFVPQFEDLKSVRFAYGNFTVSEDYAWPPFREAVKQYKEYQERSKVPNAAWPFPRVLCDVTLEHPVDTNDIDTSWYDAQGEFVSAPSEYVRYIIRNKGQGQEVTLVDDIFARHASDLRPSPVKIHVLSMEEPAGQGYKVTGRVADGPLSTFHVRLMDHQTMDPLTGAEVRSKNGHPLYNAEREYDKALGPVRDLRVGHMNGPMWCISGVYEKWPGYLRYGEELPEPDHEQPEPDHEQPEPDHEQPEPEPQDHSQRTVNDDDEAENLNDIKTRLATVGLTLAKGTSGGRGRRQPTWVVYALEKVARPLGRRPHMATSGFGIGGDDTTVESAQKAMYSLAARLAKEAKGKADVEDVWAAITAIRDLLSPTSEEWDELDRAIRDEPEPGDDAYYNDISKIPKLLKKAGVSLTAPAREKSWVVRLSAKVARAIGVTNVTTFEKRGTEEDKTTLQSAQVALSKMGDALVEKNVQNETVQDAIAAIRRCLPLNDPRRQRL